MDNKYTINPIGIEPKWIVIQRRNKDLADAISRYSNFVNSSKKENLELVREWALEIVENCNILIK